MPTINPKETYTCPPVHRGRAGCPDREVRAQHFLQLWTLKESYVKAVGRGISAPPGLSSFSFRIGGEGEGKEDSRGSCIGSDAGSSDPEISSSSGSTSSRGSILFESSVGERQGWEFMLMRPTQQHMAALCLERPHVGGGSGHVKTRVRAFEAALFSADAVETRAVFIATGLSRRHGEG
jgi:hypothetical protein